jgi:hypothetical protein
MPNGWGCALEPVLQWASLEATYVWQEFVNTSKVKIEIMSFNNVDPLRKSAGLALD